MERHWPHHVQRADEVSAIELAAPPTVFLFYGLLFMCMRVFHMTLCFVRVVALQLLGGGGALLVIIRICRFVVCLRFGTKVKSVVTSKTTRLQCCKVVGL